MKAPFPYFGGKSAVAADVWAALGQPAHYIEPFFGSGAVLLNRPNYDPASHTETVNDKDGFISNVWRSIQYSPEETAKWADWPVNHADLNARRKALLANEERLLENLVIDDMWHDPKMAGYWIWGASCSIGATWQTGKANGLGGIPQISDAAKGIEAIKDKVGYLKTLQDRLRKVRVVCGGWKRVCGGNWQDRLGTVGMFFDPPYGVKAGRDAKLYHQESLTVADDVRAWCLDRGDRPKYRIVLAGYFEEHESLLDHGWTVKKWKANGGYANRSKTNQNAHKEALFFSPGCCKTLKQETIF